MSNLTNKTGYVHPNLIHENPGKLSTDGRNKPVLMPLRFVELIVNLMVG